MRELIVRVVLAPCLQERTCFCVVFAASGDEEALHDAGDEFLGQTVLGGFEIVTHFRDGLAVGAGHRLLLEARKRAVEQIEPQL